METEVSKKEENEMKKIMMVLVFCFLFLLSCSGIFEDPAIGIVKKGDGGVFKTVDNLLKQVAGPNGDLKWSSFKASKAVFKNGNNPYKDNPDVSIVQVDIRKVLDDGKEKKVQIQFTVNTKTEACRMSAFELDGEPQSLFAGSLALMLLLGQ
jgi:hypothetical protein